jgi:dethiobiotin synthetase
LFFLLPKRAKNIGTTTSDIIHGIRTAKTRYKKTNPIFFHQSLNPKLIRYNSPAIELTKMWAK